MDRSAFPILLLATIPGLSGASTDLRSRNAQQSSGSPGASTNQSAHQTGRVFAPNTLSTKTPLTSTFLTQSEFDLLQAAFLADTLNLLLSLPNPIFVATEPQCSLLYLTGCLSHLISPPQVTRLSPEMIFPQEGETPEARLIHAISFVSANYSPGMLVIGGNSPTVPRSAIELAIARSWEFGEFVVGPCLDGGSYLFSLPSQRSRNLRWLENALFVKDKPELPLLLRHAADIGLPVKMLEYHSRVSDVQDLLHLFVCKELGSFVTPDGTFTYPLNSIGAIDSLRLEIVRGTNAQSNFEIVRR